MIQPAREDTARSDTAWISWSRVIAIVAVVIIHTAGSTAVADPATSATPLARVLDIGSIYAVPLFVMLSGALLLDPQRYRGAHEFWRKRAVRLLPAIVFWHLWYLVLRLLRGERPTAGEVLHWVFTGELYHQLYFLWIVLGLAVLTPALMPLVRRAGRRGTAVVGVLAAGATAAGAALGLSTAPVQTAVTWWLPYLGFYLLGWALRETRLRGAALVATTGAAIALAVLLIWQWRNPDVPPWLQHAPVSYYGAGVLLYTVAVFLTLRGLLASDGVLGGLAHPGPARTGRRLGDATLGIFGLHPTVIALLTATGFLGGGDPPAADAAILLARIAVVVGVSFAVVLPLRRVPGVRVVL